MVQFFYPLSIYDDVVHDAIYYLKSQYLYEKIQAEAQNCLLSIVQMIADNAFHPIRRFFAISNLSSEIYTRVQKLYEKRNSPQTNDQQVPRN
jgi:hypothetical protein